MHRHRFTTPSSCQCDRHRCGAYDLDVNSYQHLIWTRTNWASTNRRQTLRAIDVSSPVVPAIGTEAAVSSLRPPNVMRSSSESLPSESRSGLRQAAARRSDAGRRAEQNSVCGDQRRLIRARAMPHANGRWAATHSWTDHGWAERSLRSE